MTEPQHVEKTSFQTSEILVVKKKETKLSNNGTHKEERSGFCIDLAAIKTPPDSRLKWQ